MDLDPDAVIYTEAEVPSYTLPPSLALPDGKLIPTAQEWRERARPALIREFERVQYGKTPHVPVHFAPNRSFDDIRGPRPTGGVSVVFENESTREIFGGKALMRQLRVRMSKRAHSASFELLWVLPLHTGEPVPVFVGLNFWGNHTIHEMPAIRQAREIPGMEVEERGAFAHRWNLEKVIDAGYAVATAFRGELVPDNPELYNTGILNLFKDSPETPPMGAVGAWAWSLSRILDCLEVMPEIDHHRAIVIGHSRLGKAALWAAAQDERFAAVIANNSGCLGAALSRRRFGETVGIISRNFPYWFVPELSKYADNEDALPVDQHQLLALIAPRPLYIASAENDLWSDPRGEFLALKEAGEVYAFLTGKGFPLADMPAIEEPVIGRLSYHIRRGDHDLTPYDWEPFITFAESQLR